MTPITIVRTPCDISPSQWRAPRRERVRIWLQNLRTAHERMMMRYLRKRGWVVFYLDEQCRFCTAGNDRRADESCWLALYQREEFRQRQRNCK